MSMNHHKLYLDDVFALAKTIFVKSEYSAAQINARLVTIYGTAAVHPDQPHTWKYYLNACGHYHPTDTMMQVISLDTLDLIDFTKDNLVLHPATAKGYQHGTRYYKELHARFPDQESLILGILYPAEMATALSAPDFSILAFNPGFVEANEESLIVDLNDWTQSYFRRWWVQGFNVNHSLYAASFFGIFYQQLPLKILELRDNACNTAEAHSFHVRMHLASYHGLDEFLPFLTHKQAMWLYRNIAYITRHAGWQATFEWLVHNILTARGIPLTGFDLVQSSAGLLEGDDAPLATFLSKAVNDIRAPGLDYIDYRAILSKIVLAGAGNADYDLREPEAIPSTRYALQNTYQTKILESAFEDVSKGSAVSSIEMALSLWVYATHTNRFNVYTRINHPITGSEITLSSADAYYLFLYAYAKAHSNGMPIIPALHAKSAPVWPLPTANALWAICDQTEVNIARIVQMRALMPSDGTYINLDQYRNAVSALEEAMASHSLIVASADTFERQASYKAVFSALWSDQDFVKPETGTATLEYFASKSIDLGVLDTQQWQEIYLAVFTSVTGMDMQTSAAQSNMQTAMIAIMRRLSSYSVLFVDPLDAMAVRALGWSNLIIQESAANSGNYYEVPITTSLIELVPVKEHLHAELPIGNFTMDFWVDAVENTQDLLHTSDIVFVSEEHESRNDITLTQVGVTPLNALLEPDEGYIVGLEEILADPAVFIGTPNLYNSDCWPNPVIPTEVDPNDWLVISHLPILVPPELGPQLLIDFRPFSVPQNLKYFTVDDGVLELVGFESNYGDAPVDAFAPMIGHDPLDKTFAMVPYFEGGVDAWEANIGPVKPNVFDPYANIVDYIELSVFTASELQWDLPIYNSSPMSAYSLQFKPMIGVTFSLYQGVVDFDVVTVDKTKQTTVPTFTQFSNQQALNIYQSPVKMDLGSFYSNIRPFDSMTFVSKTAIYHLIAPIVNTRVMQINSLGQIGTFQLTGLTYWGATHLAVEYSGPIFTDNSTHVDADIVEQVSELAMTTSDGVSALDYVLNDSASFIDIVDFAAELALV